MAVWIVIDVSSWMSSRNFHGGRVEEYTADASSVSVKSHLDVAIFSPVGAPRVSHDEVLLVTFFAPADSCDGVVELTNASISVEDATTVKLEVKVGSVD